MTGFVLTPGAHIIFLRLVDTQVQIVRVLHQRMAFDQHL